MKKNKPRWVHYSTTKSIDRYDPALCGKKYHGSKNMDFTRDKNRVTCPTCVKYLGKIFWHCEEHGFVNGEDVTFEEKCDYCGRDVQ